MHPSDPSTQYTAPSVLAADSARLTAVHRFFRCLAESEPYAVMLGGSLIPSPFNRICQIGLAARRVCRLQEQTPQTDSQLTGGQLVTDNLEIANLHTGTQMQIPVHTTEALWTQLRACTAPTASDTRWVGYLGYEFYRYCDPALWSLNPKPPVPQELSSRVTGFSSSGSSLPVLVLCEFSEVLTLDLHTGQWHFPAHRQDAYTRLWQACLKPDPALESPANNCSLPKSHVTAAEQISHLDQYRQTFSSSLSQPDFEAAVARVQADIQAGEIYQANLSLRLEKTVHIESPYQVFARLCESNPSPFSGFLKTPMGYLVSNSPERLVRGNDSIIDTRPIAGTRGRGVTPEKDAAIADALCADEKERAEHLMLVDLLRNDLGRVCRPGSIQVDELLAIERYERVMHLVSNITGRLAPKLDMWDVLRAVFPGGTITGCPKVRCIEILNAVEPVRRDFYTGSLGWFEHASGNASSGDIPSDDYRFDWNILIRSLWLTSCQTTRDSQPASPASDMSQIADNRLSFEYNAGTALYQARIHVGAGIVADSVPAHEYRECLRKAESILGVLYACDTTTRARHL